MPAPAFLELVGQTRAEPDAHHDTLIANVHPEDRQPLLDTLQGDHFARPMPEAARLAHPLAHREPQSHPPPAAVAATSGNFSKSF